VYTFLKASWSAPWTFFPLLDADECRDVAGPDMPDATFIFQFGRIQWPHHSALTQIFPLRFTNLYAQIRFQYPGFAPGILWTGLFQDPLNRLMSSTRLSGTQTVQAYGLPHLWDRVYIDHAIAEESGQAREIHRVPTFNLSPIRGTVPRGNRSSSKFTNPANGRSSYVFSSENENNPWSNLNALEYVECWFGPNNIPLWLFGQFEVLDDLIEVNDLKGSSAWEAMNRLVDRRRGLGMHMQATATTITLLEIFSLADRPVSFGSYTLPANAWQQPLILPTEWPYTGLIDAVDFRQSTSSQYDTYEIRGADPIELMGSWSFEDENFTRRWSLDRQDEYANVDEGDATKNDLARSKDKYRDVFRHFIVVPGWDQKVGDGEGGEKTNTALKPREDGTIDTADQSPAGYWSGEKRFMPDTFLRENREYHEPPSVVDGQVLKIDPDIPDKDEEFLPLIAFVKLPKAQAADPDRWAHIEKLSQAALAPCNVRSLDAAFGVELDGNPNHALARGNWDPHTDSKFDPETTGVDWRDVIVTAAFKTDQHPHVVLRRNAAANLDAERKKTIEIRGVKFRYCAPGTVTSIKDDDATLERIHGDNLIVEDTTDRLRAFAPVVVYFASVERQAIEIPINMVGSFAPIGSMVTGVIGINVAEPVFAVVTERRNVFREGQVVTSLRTGYWSMEEAAQVF